MMVIRKENDLEAANHYPPLTKDKIPLHQDVIFQHLVLYIYVPALGS